MWRHLLIGALGGIASAVTILVMGAGIFWLWLFGDDPWPRYAEIALTTTAYTVGLAVFVGFAVAGYRGRRSK